jgi:hypothetical protein
VSVPSSTFRRIASTVSRAPDMGRAARTCRSRSWRDRSAVFVPHLPPGAIRGQNHFRSTRLGAADAPRLGTAGALSTSKVYGRAGSGCSYALFAIKTLARGTRTWCRARAHSARAPASPCTATRSASFRNARPYPGYPAGSAPAARRCLWSGSDTVANARREVQWCANRRNPRLWTGAPPCSRRSRVMTGLHRVRRANLRPAVEGQERLPSEHRASAVGGAWWTNHRPGRRSQRAAL